MNDSAANWYYTLEGKQNGPVTLAELKGLATAGTLNPRHDMVWSQGMKDWQPAGEVEGIFEKRVAATPSAAAGPAATAPAPAAVLNPDPYAPPAEIGVDSEALQRATWPGVRRLTYILVAIVLPILAQVGLALTSYFMVRNAETPESSLLILLVTALVFAVLIIYIGVQRLANVGMSRWWYLGNLVPILNLWVGYRMFACPAGYAYHKKLDGAGVALAIVYWLMIVLAVLMVAGMAFFTTSSIDATEIQRQIR